MQQRSLEVLRRMGIPPTRYRSYPHEFSGGMRQRLMIALALVLRPDFVVADEPTTALDVLVEAQIIRILHDLRREFDTSLLLITHNLGIIAEACDRVAVMYAGEIVEIGDAREVFARPAAPVHPRAAALDDLAVDDRAALHPRRPARPGRPAAGVPLPPALPRRHADLRDPVARRRASCPSGTRRPVLGGATSATAWRRARPRPSARPLEREELSVADEA